MIRKSGHRCSLATSAERVCAERRSCSNKKMIDEHDSTQLKHAPAIRRGAASCRRQHWNHPPLHRAATRNKSAFSGGPSDFNPGVPSANAVTSSKTLAQMICRQNRSIGVNKRMCYPFPGNRMVERPNLLCSPCVFGSPHWMGRAQDGWNAAIPITSAAAKMMGFAEFIIGPAEGRTRGLYPSCTSTSTPAQSW